MKQAITFLLVLVALMLPHSISAQTYTYTDAEGTIWYFGVNGTDAYLMPNPTPGGAYPSGPLVTIETTSIGTQYISHGDVLKIPSTVSVGGNTYPVREFVFPDHFAAEKVVIPATVTSIGTINHHLIRRIALEPGSQLTSIYRPAFTYYFFFPNGRICLYYDFSGTTVNTVDDYGFYNVNNNTLVYFDSFIKTYLAGYRESFDIFDNFVIGGVCANFRVDDTQEFEAPRSFIATKASYNRTFSNTTGKAVSTLYLPYPTDLPSGMQAYTLTRKGLDENGDKVFCFSPVPLGTRLEANHPYLIRITDGQTHTLPMMHNVTVPATPKTDDTAQQAGSDTDWKFYGTTMFIENPKAYAKKAYYLSGNKWWAVQNGVLNDYIAPYRCFISSPTNATPAKSFLMVLDDDDTTTSIHQLENETEQDIKSGRHTFYSIDGKRMGNDYNTLERGQMYVVNGKKFYKF